MNKQRRNTLEKLILKLEDIRELFQEVKDDIESIKDEEQEAMDNIPESLQETDRYYNMDENVSDLDYAMDVDYDSAIDEIQEYLQNCIDR